MLNMVISALILVAKMLLYVKLIIWNDGIL